MSNIYMPFKPTPKISSIHYITLSSIKKSYLHKEYSLYRTPIQKYIKYKKKKEYYLKLYNHSKIKYYLTFISKLLSKYLRKRLPYEILDITKGCLLMYCLFDTGILNIIYRKIKKK